MQTLAQSWLIYRLTGSAALLGGINFANQLPILLLSPIGGMVSDKKSRHGVILATQSLSMLLAFSLAILTLTGRVEVWHITVLAVLLGTVNAFDIPARQAFISEIVDKDDLINAIALNSMIFNGARIIGPAVAGMLISYIGEGWCFFANGVSYITVIIGLLLIKVIPHERLPQTGSAISNIVAGFRFAWQTDLIRRLLLLLGLVSILGMPYTVLMPVFADRILHVGQRELGFLMAAPGIGAFVGALSLAARRDVFGIERRVALSSAGFALSLILFSLSHNLWLSVTLLLPVGYMLMIQMASSNTLIQITVPDYLRGRVMALYSMMLVGMVPLGALLAGLLAEHISAPFTVAVGGMVCLFGAVFLGHKIRKSSVPSRLT
jgi:MFS family permease